MAGSGGGFLLIDAGVLIDFLESDPSVLPLISTRLGRLHVALPVLEEAKGLDKRDCTVLGLTLVEPTPGQMAEAAAGFGPLSFQDRICLILARANGWTCITNDTTLRRECQGAGVEVLWGLETLALLVDRGVLTVDRAKQIASRIHQANPYYINQGVLKRFHKRIGISDEP